MSLVKLRSSPPVGSIEVDGDLDVIVGYDLRRTVAAALRDGCRQLFLDLSRVSRVDAAGADSLRTCAEDVAAEGGELTLTSLSGPLRGIPGLSARSERGPEGDAATA